MVQATESRLSRPLTLVLLALTAMCFWRAGLSQALHWDDDRFLAFVSSQGSSGTEPLVRIWGQFVEGDYIPIPLTSFWLEQEIFRFSPGLIHIDNVLIHLLNVLLLLRLLNLINLPAFTSLFVVLCFAVHPLQVEPVLWLSDRKSLLNGTGLLLALWCYQRFTLLTEPRRTMYFIGYCAAFLCSLLCKATTLLLPFGLVVFEWLICRQHLGKRKLCQLIPITLACAFGGLRMYALAAHVGIESSAIFSPARLLTAIAASLTAIGHYLKAFFWPLELSPFYATYDRFPHATLLAFAGLALLSLWGALAAWTRSSLQWTSLLLYLIFLVPVLPLFPRANFVNDRYMYLPIIGLSCSVGHMLNLVAQKLRWPRTAQLALLLAVALAFALCSEHQSRMWQNDETFWKMAANRNPRSALVLNNLAMHLRDRGQVVEATATLRYALDLPPEPTAPRGALWLNLGDLHGESKWPTLFNLNTALTCYQQALASADRPQDRLQALLRLKAVHSYLGRTEDAAAIEAQLRQQP
ncbi:MAG: tetratricopeptide repeat protein [Deltaproteobacteria bacterium]|nr:tetratricopeptide repeat protein [Deltaproteobacteria bacterium]